MKPVNITLNLKLKYNHLRESETVGFHKAMNTLAVLAFAVIVTVVAGGRYQLSEQEQQEWHECGAKDEGMQ